MPRNDGNTPRTRRRNHKAMHSASKGKGHDSKVRLAKHKVTKSTDKKYRRKRNGAMAELGLGQWLQPTEPGFESPLPLQVAGPTPAHCHPGDLLPPVTDAPSVLTSKKDNMDFGLSVSLSQYKHLPEYPTYLLSMFRVMEMRVRIPSRVLFYQSRT